MNEEQEREGSAKTGDVNPKSPGSQGVGKVVEEKLVYYCSSFDLNVNEWFMEYENTELFKRRIKNKLGKTEPILIAFRPKLDQILPSGDRGQTINWVW